MENINEQFKRLFCELDLTDDQAAMIKKLQRDVNAALGLSHFGKSLPIGDVEILLKGLEHIGKWDDEEEERWDDPGDCAMDALTQYRYSMSIR